MPAAACWNNGASFVGSVDVLGALWMLVISRLACRQKVDPLSDPPLLLAELELPDDDVDPAAELPPLPPPQAVSSVRAAAPARTVRAAVRRMRGRLAAARRA
jgi:hypothetical protein